MNKINWILAVVVTCLAIGYFSGMVTRSAITTWYPTLINLVLIHPIGFCTSLEYVICDDGCTQDWFGTE
jgi:hypothetical protein